MQARVHAHYILVCLSPFLGPILSDQDDWGMYEIRETWQSFLCTYWDLCTQASVHAHCILVCLGPYHVPIVLDQGDWDIYEIRVYASHFWAHIEPCPCKLVCMHTVSCVPRPISWLFSIRSGWLRHLWDKEDILVISEHIMKTVHISWCACKLFSCVLGPMACLNCFGSVT